jgi:hypothetical protein
VSPGRRALTFFLAFLPAAWGLCVGCLVRPAAAETAVASGGEAPRVALSPCGCCHAGTEDPAAPTDEDGREAPSPEPCGCGWSEAGRGVVPPDAAPVLPDAAATPVATLDASAPAVLAVVSEGPRSTAPREVLDAPRERLAGVVLID